MEYYKQPKIKSFGISLLNKKKMELCRIDLNIVKSFITYSFMNDRIPKTTKICSFFSKFCMGLFMVHLLEGQSHWSNLLVKGTMVMFKPMASQLLYMTTRPHQPKIP